MTISWSPLAMLRAVEAAEYIARHKPGAASRWIERLFATVARLEEFPRMGRRIPELDREDLREIVYGEYRVLYRLRASAIEILTVRHGRQRFDATEAGIEPDAGPER